MIGRQEALLNLIPENDRERFDPLPAAEPEQEHDNSVDAFELIGGLEERTSKSIKLG